MDLSLILDILLCAVIAAAFFIGLKRGFLRTVWGLGAFVLAVVLTIVIKPYTTDFFRGSVLHYMVEDKVYTAVLDRIPNAPDAAEGGSKLFSEAYSMPEKYAENAAEVFDSAAEKTAEAAAAAAADTVASITEAILLFVSLRLALAIIYSVLKLIFKFPLLKQTNKLAGAAVQTALALAAVYTVFAAAAVMGTDIFADTVLCKAMYNNNILLALLGL